MEIKIEIIQKTGKYYNGEKIVEIDIKNGHWKYWDIQMETSEKIGLTINNLSDATILNQPVKDAYGFHDKKAWEENNEVKIRSAMVRTYETLLNYLNHRINNVKEEYKNKNIWKILEYDKNGMVFNACLFEETYHKVSDDTVVNQITYENRGLIEVIIKVIE